MSPAQTHVRTPVEVSAVGVSVTVDPLILGSAEDAVAVMTPADEFVTPETNFETWFTAEN